VVSEIWNQSIQESNSAKVVTTKFKRLRKGLKLGQKNLQPDSNYQSHK